jgi:putrescine aminotransferase
LSSAAAEPVVSCPETTHDHPPEEPEHRRRSSRTTSPIIFIRSRITRPSTPSGGPRVITHGDGVYVWDGKGNKILDGMSGLWCVNIGYGRKDLADVAYKQMLDLPYYNTFFKTTTVPATELAAKISSVMPERFQHIFFTNSGSEGNDTIVRWVRHYWKVMGKPYRQHIIGRRRGYHGSTWVAANLGGMQGMHEQGGTQLPGFHHIQQPYWYDFGGDKTPEEFGLEAAAELEKKILELGPDNVAAFIGEPIQGAAGVLIPPRPTGRKSSASAASMASSSSRTK